ncbi:MAG: hypothetical protein Q9190_001916 [Brigantiaea leucoxantha]
MESPLPADPYKTLDVTKDATLATIRSAHRKLVLKTHPDKVQGDEALKKQRAELFHQVQQAYEILSDDTKRQQYDDRVKLASLKVEMMAERGAPRIFSETGPRSNGYTPTVEVRGGRVYEERVPRRSYEDRSGDDFFSFKPRDSRPSPGKFADDYTSSASRKSSLRSTEEKRRLRDLEDLDHERIRYERATVKQEKKTMYAERERRRDRERRKDYTTKHNSRATYVEDYSDSSDSSDTEVYVPRKYEGPPKRVYEEVRIPKGTAPHRSNKHDSDESSDEVKSKVNDAASYIHFTSRPTYEHERRPSAFKISSPSARDVRPPIAPISIDGARRSKTQTRVRDLSPPPKVSAKGRRYPTEIVEPPEETRKSTVPGSSSDPKGIRNLLNSMNRGKPHRASTGDHMVEPRVPGIRRADTMPINRSRHDDHAPAKSTRLKEHDSGYSSPGTPPGLSPQMKSTKYTIVEDEDEISRGYNTVRAEPDEPYRRNRDISPPRARKSSDRPAASRMMSNARMPRSTSYVVEPDEIRPAQRLQRAETARAPPLSSRPSTNNSRTQFFGEIPQTEEPYRIVNSSPKYGREDIRFSNVRRGSEDRRDFDRDVQSHSRSSRPIYSRSESRVSPVH